MIRPPTILWDSHSLKRGHVHESRTKMEVVGIPFSRTESSSMEASIKFTNDRSFDDDKKEEEWG